MENMMYSQRFYSKKIPISEDSIIKYVYQGANLVPNFRGTSILKKRIVKGKNLLAV